MTEEATVGEHSHTDECGEHPGCTCPMTGDPLPWHDPDCAAHDDDARENCPRRRR